MGDYDLASSDGAYSSKSFTPSCTSSSPSLDLNRPQQSRQKSFTHVFPANSSGSGQGCSARGAAKSKNSRAALRELLNPTSASVGSKDRTELLNSGLQWLLENSTSSHKPNGRVARRSMPLSHEAVGTFNSKNERGNGATINDSNIGSHSTKTWLDDQVKTNKALPPW